MKELFLVIATVLTIAAVIPYIIDIFRGNTKPNLVSWITWTLLTGVATAAEFFAGEYVTALFTSAATLATLSVIIVGLMKRAYVRYTRFDILCQLAAFFGIILWQFFSAPVIAVFASISIDLVGALPTLKHSYQKPDEETWITYAVSSLGAVFALLALQTYNWVSLPYAMYLVVMNALMVIVIMYSRKRIAQ